MCYFLSYNVGMDIDRSYKGKSVFSTKFEDKKQYQKIRDYR